MATRYTIYTTFWHQALRVLPGLPEPWGTIADDARMLLEQGWYHVAAISEVVEVRLRDLDSDSREPNPALYHFCDSDVVDVFRGMAVSWVSGVLNRHDYSPEDLGGELSLFRRYVAVAEMASRVPGIDADLRDALDTHGDALLRWCVAAAPLFDKFADAIPDNDPE